MNDSFNSHSPEISDPQDKTKLIRSIILVISALLLALLVFHVLNRNGNQTSSTVPPPPTNSTNVESSIVVLLSTTESTTSSPTPDLVASLPAPLTIQEPDQTVQGAIILAIKEGEYTHLFYCQPSNCALNRLTYGPWDDITPAISADGKYLAFASNRNGFWDLYQLELGSGVIVQLTNTTEYDASPSWSPDGRWLSYESYVTDPATNTSNLEIFIREITASNPETQTPIRLTDDPGADYSPAWSPVGRQIAFVSTRDGDEEIWIANLDSTNNRYQKISLNELARDNHPAWSPDGQYLAWSTYIDGVQNIVVSDRTQPADPPRAIGGGSWAAWDVYSKSLAVILESPNQTYLTGYQSDSSQMILPMIHLRNPASGITWMNTSLPQPLPDILQAAAQVTPAPSWQAAESSDGITSERHRIVYLNDISAPFPQLHDAVDEAFFSLRSEISRKSGWDFLSTLENAYVPLTSPLYPGMVDDWLYTGRSFAFNTASANAGWAVVVREDFGAQIYWRVLLRSRFQDGSQGSPLHHLTWDFYARNSGDPRAYEQGGQLIETIPQGYWIDFTQIARGYGWERLPALSGWRLALPSANYNEYALTDGLSWYNAMLELYPAEAVITQTPLPPPSLTPTRTPRPTRTPTPTMTLIPTRTLPPTLTLTPTKTPTVTATSSFSATPTATELIVP
ncbi:MAG: PD40 domain-containing protein [Anaerolineales bacterium]|nr:PD40 domain-containing protein [Anaerolineales bacterium]